MRVHVRQKLILILGLMLTGATGVAATTTVDAAEPYAGRTITLPGGARLEVPAEIAPDSDFDCSAPRIHCVPSEFRSLQAAADVVEAGDTVVAARGRHQSFVLRRSGSRGAPIRFIGRPGATIDRYPYSEHGIVLRSDFEDGFFVDYIHIVGFTIIAPEGRCIYFADAISSRPTRGHVLSRNRCIDAGEHGIYLSQVERSYISRNFVVNAGRGEQLHGMYFANGGSGDNIVFANVIVGAENNGIHCNGDRSVDYLADGSRGGSRGTDGLITGMLFDANLIVASGQSGINLDGVQASRFINNVIHASRRHGIRGYVIDGAAGPAGLEFANNTLIANNSAIKLSESPRDARTFLLNNLYVAQREDAVVIDAAHRERGSLAVRGLDFVAPAVIDGRDFEAEIGAYDYRVAPSQLSRIRDRGVDALDGVPAPGHDLYGLPRDARPDIGAVEHR